MIRPFATIGDRTTHGGVVVTADLTTTFNDKPAARTGDMTVCPKCKGQFPITTGAPDMIDGQGNRYARHMDETACGARLISSQAVITWSDESSMGEATAGGSAEAMAAATAAVARPTESGVCLDCLLNAAASGSSTVVRE
jgi:uncharacterized Zn-binding protein involved in type VI secretion